MHFTRSQFRRHHNDGKVLRLEHLHRRLTVKEQLPHRVHSFFSSWKPNKQFTHFAMRRFSCTPGQAATLMLCIKFMRGDAEELQLFTNRAITDYGINSTNEQFIITMTSRDYSHLGIFLNIYFYKWDISTEARAQSRFSTQEHHCVICAFTTPHFAFN